MRRSRSGEAGFTVVELLVVTLIGGIVLLALFNIVEASDRATTRITQRIDSAQHGRIAMEQITQSLRSQVCIKDDPVLTPIAVGMPNRLAFYAAMPSKVAGQAKPTDFAPLRRELRYEPATGQILEESSPGSGSYPELTFPAPTRRRVLAGNIVPVTAGAPIFTYYALLEDGSVSTTPLPLPLDLDGRESVVRIDIQFAARPSSGPRNRGTDTGLKSSVTVRLPTRTDSDNPGSGPACML